MSKGWWTLLAMLSVAGLAVNAPHWVAWLVAFHLCIEGWKEER